MDNQYPSYDDMRPQDPTPSDTSTHVGPPPQPEPDTNALSFELTTKESAILFAQAGVPRSTRSIERMCDAGHLECKKFLTTRNTEQWLVNKDSIGVRIQELRQSGAMFTDVSRNDAPERDTSRHDATQRVESRRDATNDAPEDSGRVKELQRELENERVLRKAREFYTDKLEEERVAMQEQLHRDAHIIGRMEERLLTLGAPPNDIVRLKAPTKATSEPEPPSPEPSVPDYRPIDHDQHQTYY